MNLIKSKLLESLKSILPIALIVFILSITITPISSGDMLLFLIGIAFLVFGMSLFNMGAEMSMQPLGVKIGSSIASSGKIWLMALVSFIIGIIVTISEPDLQILAEQVSDIPNLVTILRATLVAFLISLEAPVVISLKIICSAIRPPRDTIIS